MLEHMHTRTRRQKDVFEYISRYITKHGHEPSYQVIARDLGLNSKAGIAKHIKSLEEQGLVKRKRVNGSFSLELCKNGREIRGDRRANPRLSHGRQRVVAVPELALGGAGVAGEQLDPGRHE